MAGYTFAATLLITVGVFQVIMGIAAILNGAFYVAAPHYLFSMSTTGWGWIHIALGALFVVCGSFLFLEYSWAAVTAIALAVLSAINNFLFLPYYPFWSLLVIAADVFVIWSLATMVNSRARPTRTWQPPAETAGEKWPPANTGRRATDVPVRPESHAGDAPAERPPARPIG
jgi:hypothetical protein